MPAPPPESEPAMVSAFGTVIDLESIRPAGTASNARRIGAGTLTGPSRRAYRGDVKRADPAPTFETRRWTRLEYDRLIDVGILDEDDPIELVAGHLVVREPQSSPHATATDLVSEALRRAFGRGWRVRAGLPLALGQDSEPEPDISVVRGAARDFVADHPSTAALIAEIALSSLAFNRTVKAQLYARARIADYWIVNLVDRVVEIHRDPTPGRDRRGRYRVVTMARPGESIVPLAAPVARIAVDDLLP
jgi:Uma2 family endonuclease